MISGVRHEPPRDGKWKANQSPTNKRQIEPLQGGGFSTADVIVKIGQPGQKN